MGSKRLVVLGLWLLPLPALAQNRVTISGGPALGRIAIEDLETGLESRWRWGWEASVGLARSLRPGLSLGLRASWMQAGGRVEEIGSGARLDLDVQELTVPLVLEVRGSGERFRPYAFGGPGFVWRRRAELALSMDGRELVREDITSDVDRTGWALAAGAGIELGSGSVRPFLEAQYLHGLTGLDPSGPAAEDFVGAHGRSFQFRAGMSFGR